MQGSDNDLDQCILRAILSDCERTADAVMHAVLWGQPSIIKHQLQSSSDVDPRWLGHAFEQALMLARSSETWEARRVLQELIHFNVQPSHVRFDQLFDNVRQSRQVGFIRQWQRRVSRTPSLGRMASLRRGLKSQKPQKSTK